jgi:two-component system sensor histidine kinase RegB
MGNPQIFVDGSRLRLNTTIRLRWFAVAGQLATILMLRYGLGFPVPLAPCLIVIGLSAALNVVLSVAYPRSQRLVAPHAMALLSYDILQLSALLFLTGGLQNPFAFLMVVPVAVSASTQPLPITGFLVGLAIASASGLAVYHWPLPWGEEAVPSLPDIYMAGMWAALVSCIGFIAIYAWRIGEEARQMSQALTAAELVLAREQKLTALDGLAAAAAHQLGTPLSTIALVARELERTVPADSPLREDINLMQSQVARCRDILSELSRSGREGDDDHIFSRMRLSHILEEVVQPFRAPGLTIAVKVKDRTQNGKGSEPIVPRNPGLMHGLTNIIENAAEFAESQVAVEATYDEDSVRLKISDDGPGFHPQVINHLGEPYVSKRQAAAGIQTGDEHGMGLGFFIAKTLLERSGATVGASNRLAAETGAIVTVTWERDRLEAELAA